MVKKPQVKPVIERQHMRAVALERSPGREGPLRQNEEI